MDNNHFTLEALKMKWKNKTMGGTASATGAGGGGTGADAGPSNPTPWFAITPF